MIFWKENPVLGFLGQKGPKWVQNEVFKFYEKSTRVFFCRFFLHKLQRNKFFKLTDLNDFRRKILFGVYRVKRGQSGPKLRFFKFYEKLTLIKLAYKLKNWPKWLFGKNLVLRFQGQKRPEMGPKWNFSGIIKSLCIRTFTFFFFCIKLQHNKDIKLT